MLDHPGASEGVLGAMLVQVGAKLGFVVGSWGMLGCLGRLLGPLGGILEVSWGILGTSWVASWGHLGGILRHLKMSQHLAPSWVDFWKGSWGILVSSWPHLGLILGQVRGHLGFILGLLGLKWGHLEGCVDLCWDIFKHLEAFCQQDALRDSKVPQHRPT